MAYQAYTQDDLASLLSRHLTLNAEVASQEQVDRSTASQPPPSTVYSISQHYHHSSHSPRHAETGRPSSETGASSSNHASEAAVLRNHGIDPSSLTPSQITLFKTAEPSQKRRLLELWTIVPPGGGMHHSHPGTAMGFSDLAWSSTTLEQEEQLARLRYERMQQSQFVPPPSASACHPAGQPSQSISGEWPAGQHAEPEPYILSGYSELMRRERERDNQKQAFSPLGTAVGAGPLYSAATDPVYLAAEELRQRQQLQMASQYGSFDHFRGGSERDGMAMDVM